MEKHLLTNGGCKGWGGTLAITLGQGKKIAYTVGGIRSPVVDCLSELTGWPSIDVFKNGKPPTEEIGLVVIDCGGALRCGLYPKRGTPTINLRPAGKSGLLAEFIREGTYVFGVTPACIEMAWPQGEGGKLGIVADDLTEVTTVGALPTHNGLKTAAFFSTEFFSRSEVGYPVMIASSDNRPLPKAEAQHKASAVVKQLQARGAHYLIERIDTMLHGGIGSEINVMLEQLPQETVTAMVSVMPQLRRIPVGSRSVADSIVLSRTDTTRNVCTPVTESWVPEPSAAQIHHQVRHIVLTSVTKDEGQIQQDLQE